MKRLALFLWAAAILVPMFSVHDAYARSSENEADCRAWCNQNKPRCAFCDKDAFCEGRQHDVIKSFKQGTGNWYACGLSDHALRSRENERQCKQWCSGNEACEKCTSSVCGRGIKLLKTFRGTGENWYACQKTNWAEHSASSRDQATKWCADYKRNNPGQDCRIVKSANSCPRGFYKSERLKVRWGRDYKACLTTKVDSQRVKDCPGTATANIEKALDWINDHSDTILGNYRLQPRDLRNRRAHERMDRKFSVATVTCEDHREKCRKKAAPYGWSAGGRKIHLCYNRQTHFCGLVKTIIHEAGHNAWADMEWDQHHGSSAGRADDTVHVLGFRAQDLCRGDNYRGTNISPRGARSYNFKLKP